MRLNVLTVLLFAALGTTATSAETQWTTYVDRDLEFAFDAPGQVKVEKGTYKAERTGSHPAIVFKADDKNVEYTATVVDFSSQLANSANLFEEAVDTFIDGNKVLSDTIERTGDWFGRKISVDLRKSAGRSVCSFFFIRGHLYQLKATVSANGDYGSPDMARFVDSGTYQTRQMDTGAIELKVPK